MGVGAGAISAVAGIAAAGISAYSAMETGQAQSKAAAYSAQVAQNNATIANQNAVYATRAGEAQAQNESLKNAQRFGAIRAAEGANNVDVNSGSAVDVQTSEREIGELDTLSVMNNAMLKAYGYKSQATGFNAQAGLDTAEGQQALIGGDLSAAGDLLSGASSVGFKWAGMNSGSDPTQNLGFNTPTAATLGNPD